MARLRVPASPVETRRAKHANAGAGNRTASQPRHSGPQPEISAAFDSSANDHAERSTTYPRIVRSFALMDVETKRDVQGYLVGQYKAVKKMGHEHITPTGTKIVFFFGQAQQEEEFDILDENMKGDLREYVNEDEDADHPWCGVRDFMRKIATSKAEVSTELKDTKHGLGTETPHQARLVRAHSAPSLAQCIANASIDSAGSDTDPDSEDDDIDLELRIENALSSFAKKVEELEDVAGALSITPPSRTYSDARSSTSAPPKDIDIPYPCGPNQNSRLRRHSGYCSLASLIAHAEDTRAPSCSSLSSCLIPPGTTYNVVRKPCYDPDFEGHSPCATHDEGSWGLSADDALDMLQERFRITHCAGDGTGFDRREWLEYKLETGRSMVHGPSLLPFGTNCYEAEKPGQIKDADDIPYANRPEATARIRTSPSKDTLSTNSSVRNSVFSKCTSSTSISSYRTSRPQSARTEHSRLMNALSPDNDTEKCGHGYEISAPTVCSPSVAGIVPKSEHFQGYAGGTVRDGKGAHSLPVTTTKKWSSGLKLWEDESWPNAPERIGTDFEDAQNSITRSESEDRNVEEFSQLRASLTIVTDNDEPMRPEIIANRLYAAPRIYEEAANFVEHVATNSDVDSECWSEPLDGCAQPRRKWTSKMKHCLQKIPQKTKQATHDYLKATKRFSRTAWRVLPAALSSRHPFEKIDGIL
ncbi:hypothetical protein J4E93_003042 [Alternaria ventricosa]|uniref:uncharacterized protein n=1 Tax=Alternaria ventricosa TaxID=1187951 RepID=UPI0020C3A962|nr:uncharacterized protein J4E93_003042 [Alternaria ventricosa]KAI4650685.1 hypothetical protein J4E93_003042 [Alternaria ventricosa]